MGDTSTTQARAYAGDPSQPLIMIWPGWGMGARYYRPLAEHLSAAGFPTAIGELRGQGESSARPSRSETWGYHDMVSEDYPRTVRGVKARLGLEPDHPTVLLCHSMGGQIGTLFLTRPECHELNVIGMIGVGAGTPYFKGFEGKNRWRLAIGAPLMRLTSTFIGYQPEGILDLAGYGMQARRHVIEWSHLALANNFNKVHTTDVPYPERLKEITPQVLLLRFAGDEDCPRASMDNLAAQIPRAHVQLEELPEELGHNRWARNPEAIVRRVQQWISAQSAGQDPNPHSAFRGS